MISFRKNRNKGFTLIELLIVIAIIGILAAVATTAYVGTMLKADRSEAYTNLNSLRLLEEQFYAESACYYTTGGACTNATLSGVASIQGFLPGFQPGTSLNFDYSITTTTVGTIVAGCFTATATGITGTRPGNQVPPDVFAIDCNNNKNF